MRPHHLSLMICWGAISVGLLGNFAAPPCHAQDETEDTSGVQLLDGFEPPRPVHPLMKLNKPPLVTADELDAWKKTKQGRDFPRVLRSGESDTNSKQIIRDGVKMRIYEMTLEDNRRILHQLRNDFLTRELFQAGRLQNDLSSRRAFREFVMGEVTARAQELLDNNFYVRLQAVLILGALNSIEEVRLSNPVAEEAYGPAAKVLLEVVKSPDQPQAIKVVAVNGMKRIATTGKLVDSFRVEMANALIAAVDDPQAHYWYQMRLVEALPAMDVLRDPLQDGPIVVNKLQNIVSDQKRHWVVRSAAAKAVGRTRFEAKNVGAADGDIDVADLSRRIAALAREMANAYNKSPHASFWRNAFFDVYLAFQPLDSEERARNYGLLQRVEEGSFAQFKQTTEAAYRQVVLPMVKTILQAGNPTPLPSELLNDADEWLNANKAVAQSRSAGNN